MQWYWQKYSSAIWWRLIAMFQLTVDAIYFVNFECLNERRRANGSTAPLHPCVNAESVVGKAATIPFFKSLVWSDRESNPASKFWWRVFNELYHLASLYRFIKNLFIRLCCMLVTSTDACIFNTRASHSCDSDIFDHNSPTAREVFEPSIDTETLLVLIF